MLWPLLRFAMRPVSHARARVKPALRGQENKGQNQRAQHVILPGVSRVAPEKELLDGAENVVHKIYPPTVGFIRRLQPSITN